MIPTKIEDLIIPERYSVTVSGTKFLLKDINITRTKQNDHILIFSTNANLNYLRSSNEIYADGTLKTVPTLFYQLYSIHGSLNGKVLRLVLNLCTGKNKKLYRRMFHEIKDLEPRLSSNIVMADFELTFTQAAQRELGVEVKGCFFHFTQCIWRKIQKCGLQEKYASDSQYAINLRMLCALAFVPPDDVAYDALIASKFYSEHMDLLNELLEYFERT